MSKLLFLVFSENACVRSHAFLYGIDLKKKGNEVKIILEGPALQCIKGLSDKESYFGKLFEEARELDIIAGVCKTAAHGCGKNDDGNSEILSILKEKKISLISDLNNHAGISQYVTQGYQVITF